MASRPTRTRKQQATSCAARFGPGGHVRGLALAGPCSRVGGHGQGHPSWATSSARESRSGSGGRKGGFLGRVHPAPPPTSSGGWVRASVASARSGSGGEGGGRVVGLLGSGCRRSVLVGRSARAALLVGLLVLGPTSSAFGVQGGSSSPGRLGCPSVRQRVSSSAASSSKGGVRPRGSLAWRDAARSSGLVGVEGRLHFSAARPAVRSHRLFVGVGRARSGPGGRRIAPRGWSASPGRVRSSTGPVGSEAPSAASASGRVGAPRRRHPSGSLARRDPAPGVGRAGAPCPTASAGGRLARSGPGRLRPRPCPRSSLAGRGQAGSILLRVLGHVLGGRAHPSSVLGVLGAGGRRGAASPAPAVRQGLASCQRSAALRFGGRGGSRPRWLAGPGPHPRSASAGSPRRRAADQREPGNCRPRPATVASVRRVAPSDGSGSASAGSSGLARRAPGRAPRLPAPVASVRARVLGRAGGGQESRAVRRGARGRRLIRPRLPPLRHVRRASPRSRLVLHLRPRARLRLASSLRRHPSGGWWVLGHVGGWQVRRLRRRPGPASSPSSRVRLAALRVQVRPGPGPALSRRGRLRVGRGCRSVLGVLRPSAGGSRPRRSRVPVLVLAPLRRLRVLLLGGRPGSLASARSGS